MVTTTQAEQDEEQHLYIDEWMAELGFTDETLAEKMNSNRTTVWRWRNEQHRLNPQKIADIARAMGREPQELWHPPPKHDRPSIDAIVKDASDEVVRKAADVVSIIVKKTGT